MRDRSTNGDSVRLVHGTRPDGSGVRVHVDAGRVTAVEAAPPGPDGLVSPGFVDLQVNGMGDVDCNHAGAGDWSRITEDLAATGVTAWLPTLVTRPLDTYASPLDDIAGAMRAQATGPPVGARILGVHLEGPFLGERAGAHRRDHVVDVDDEWLAALPDHVRLVTLGPEQPGALPAIRALVARGVAVSLGHTAADLATATAAVDAGARMVTHLFNAMAPLHHREPGVVGLGLTDDRVVAGLIADGVHVHPSLLPMVVRAKGAERVAVVTDAVAWRSQRLGSLGIEVVDGAPRLPDGTIAGSALTSDRALRNLVDAGVALDDALTTLTRGPASVLGSRGPGTLGAGTLEVGAPADLVLLAPDELTVRRTVVGGVVVAEGS